MNFMFLPLKFSRLCFELGISHFVLCHFMTCLLLQMDSDVAKPCHKILAKLSELDFWHHLADSVIRLLEAFLNRLGINKTLGIRAKIR